LKGRQQQPGQQFSMNAIGIQTENLVVFDKRLVGAVVLQELIGQAVFDVIGQSLLG
jgi:hypothetical protein